LGYSVLSAILMGCLVSGWMWLTGISLTTVVIAVLIGAAAYLNLLWLIGEISKEEKEYIISKVTVTIRGFVVRPTTKIGKG
jgi:hypothetical protein